VVQSEIKLLRGVRAFGNGDYWKLITRIQTSRRRLGGNELVGEYWGDERENDIEDANVNIVTRPQDDVPLGESSKGPLPALMKTLET
jgi:hypothetical protein